MTYATAHDVAGRLPLAQAGGTWHAPLTAAQVDTIIEGVSAEIDARLAGCGHTTPVTTPAGAVTYLTTLNVWGSAAEIQRARFRDTNAAAKEAAWSFYEDRYQKAMASLCEWAEGALAAQGSGSLPASFATTYPDTDDEPEWGTNELPVFVDTMRF